MQCTSRIDFTKFKLGEKKNCKVTIAADEPFEVTGVSAILCNRGGPVEAIISTPAIEQIETTEVRVCFLLEPRISGHVTLRFTHETDLGEKFINDFSLYIGE